jgi:hypothetical protein
MQWFLEMVPFRSPSNQIRVCPVVQTFVSLQITFPSLQRTCGHLAQNLLKPEAGLIILSGDTALHNF